MVLAIVASTLLDLSSHQIFAFPSTTTNSSNTKTIGYVVRAERSEKDKYFSNRDTETGERYSGRSRSWSFRGERGENEFASIECMVIFTSSFTISDEFSVFKAFNVFVCVCQASSTKAIG